MQLFLSYRRSDAQSATRQLAQALERRFGDDSVFFDVDDLSIGEEWLARIRGRVEAADVVLAVIGPHWLDVLTERTKRTRLDGRYEDVMRLEIETALRAGATVVPVLVDDAQMPAADAMPRPFRPLAGLEARALSGTAWDRDVDALAKELAELRPRAARLRPARAAGAETPAPRRRNRSDAARIAGHMADGSLVTVFGAGVNAADRSDPWEAGNGVLPDAAELARHLARRFSIGDDPDDHDLARVAQEMALTEGRVDLCRTLRELLGSGEVRLGAAHRFAARLPGLLRDLGHDGHQLLVTNNYDTALEQALDELHEPYDLVVFMAAGEYRGRFMHVPWFDPGGPGAVPITVPNEYVDLPIDEDARLERTIVLKVHGGLADLGAQTNLVRDNFLVTEDDYIGYLTQSPIESLVPLQILNKVRDSHFLFLGYPAREWHSRVILQRLWREQRLQARSWATVTPPDDVEEEIWEQFGVDVIEQSLADFFGELELELDPAAT